MFFRRVRSLDSSSAALHPATGGEKWDHPHILKKRLQQTHGQSQIPCMFFLVGQYIYVSLHGKTKKHPTDHELFYFTLFLFFLTSYVSHHYPTRHPLFIPDCPNFYLLRNPKQINKNKTYSPQIPQFWWPSHWTQKSPLKKTRMYNLFMFNTSPHAN